MTWGIHQILLGIHILLAICWVGGILFVGWGIFPVTRKFPPQIQQSFLQSLMKWTHLLFILEGLGVIITGFLLGTVFGPLQQWTFVWHTTYGHIWVTALFIAIFTLTWGATIGYWRSMKAFRCTEIWEEAATGNKQSLLHELTIVALFESVEVAGFIALIICMVLLN